MTAPSYACRDVVALVTEYLEGGLSTDERLGFERHVAICPPCRGYFAQMRRVVALAAAAGEPEELPATLRDGLLAAFADWKAERDE